MSLWHVIILAIVQGMAELLPVSSSAHVIVAEKLMGMDPASPDMTLLLVMLHTGTMVAVIVYFWQRWHRAFFSNKLDFRYFVVALILALVMTGVVAGGIIEGIEKGLFRHVAHAWVEELFARLDLIALSLAAAGALILVAGLFEGRTPDPPPVGPDVRSGQALWIGAVQGLCLPFRGFSRSGATISTGLLTGVPKIRAEDFSFALAVILTPAADTREAWRLFQSQNQLSPQLAFGAGTSLIGALAAFLAGLLALKWLSRWLEEGRWYWFGIYCLAAAAGVAWLHYHLGY
jgi:undecaprenyl-diphosphatase